MPVPVSLTSRSRTLALTGAAVLAAGTLLVGGASPSTASDADADRRTAAYAALVQAGSTPSSGFRSSAATAEQIGDSGLRLFGDNRYETAVAISETLYADGEPFVVYLATGLGFADALAMAASDFALGPLLLTLPDTLPAVTATEVGRLQPCLVVVVGGPSVVSQAVAEQAESLADINQDKCAGV